MSDESLHHEVGAATLVGESILQVCRVCGLVWVPDFAADPVCPAKLAARVPKPRCRMWWRPGVLVRPGMPRGPVQCSHPPNHEGEHHFPGVTEPASREGADDVD